MLMSNSIAVINAGSSSVKFAIYQANGDERCLFRGQIEGIGVAPRLRITDEDGGSVEDRTFAAEGFDHGAATREIMETGRALLKGGSVVAFGHRVTFRRDDGRRQVFRIVGEDEADARNGSISYVSPVARALIGRAAGEIALVGDREIEILSID